MKRIKLTQGKYALVDDNMFEELNQLKWQFHISGYAVHEMRIKGEKGKRKTVMMHRVIINTPEDRDTDHINGNRLDNRKKNLRIVTTSQNLMNQKIKANNTSGVTGVYWSKKSKKWQAYISLYKKTIQLGLFRDKEIAILARKWGEKLYFKEYRFNNAI